VKPPGGDRRLRHLGALLSDPDRRGPQRAITLDGILAPLRSARVNVAGR